MNPNKALIESGWSFAIAVSGGGQEIIGELTKYGGMSNTLLEAIVPYSVPAFHRLVGGKPDHIVSPEAARAAAMVCYKRAMEYMPNAPVFGFASTSSVVKVDGEREGRKHRISMAIQDMKRTMSMDFVLTHGRSRIMEERLVTNCIRVALMWGCHRYADMRWELGDLDEFSVKTHVADTAMRMLLHGDLHKSTMVPTKAIFPSACNPLHEGHLNILKDASQRLSCPVDIELCIRNADKPPLDYLTIKERMDATQEIIKNNPSVGTIIATNKSLFFDKAELFPGATFVMGMDTFDRIMNPKYYPGGDMGLMTGFMRFEKLSCKMLVYPRIGYVPITSKDMIEYSQPVMTIVKSFDGYEASALSSTELRRKNVHS